METNNINKKVYLISDHAGELSDLIQIIRQKGYQLVNDEDVEAGELISRICTIHPDLIFWDDKAFDRTSLKLLQELSEHVETASTPIYLVDSPNGTRQDFADDLESFEQVTTLDRSISDESLNSLLDGAFQPTVGIKFWGVRGSTPCANKENIIFGGNTTCVQIELPYSSELLVLDSGTGIRNLGNYLNEFRDNVEGHIFITHPHWDHIQGFPFFKPIYNSNSSFKVHMPPQVTGGCREILSGHLTKTFFPVTLDMFDANLEYITQEGAKQQYDGYSIEYQPANHPINTAIYKVEVAGRTIVFCPDNELTPIENKTNAYFYKKLKEFFKNVDVLIHDAQYDKKAYQNKKEWGHSAWETAVDFAIRSGVKNLFLTHHDPDSNDTYLGKLDAHIKEKFGEYFESVQMAKEGAKIKLDVTESVSS